MTLRTRLALTFFLTALVTGAAVAWFGVSIATRYVEKAEQALAEVTEASSRTREVRRQEDVAEALDGLAELLAQKMDGADSPDQGLALGTAYLAGLDILQLVDAEGAILCSLHWPEQVGSKSMLLMKLSDGSGQLIRVPGPESEDEAFVVPVSIPHPLTTWTLIGGVYTAGEELPVVFTPHGVSGTSLARPMLFAGLAFALLAGLIGILLARILTRPLDEMTRALDAVAAGDENHDYPQPRGDEFGPMVASFSRMRSSLDREQARLQAVERVAAWRETARRVAHEIKNPLVPIRLTMENLIKARRQGEDVFDPIFEEGAQAVLEEVGRLGRIVDAFSAYAQMPAPKLQPADLDRILNPVAALFAGEGKVQVIRDLASGGIPVAADPDLLGQAFRNILSNCREALGDGGGEIRIRTGVDQGYGVVEITDSGPGFTDDVLERLFDPYFTTREEGTGLGMAITQRIVTEHGGSVIAGNGPGGGARFTVSIPLAAPGS